MADSDLPDIGLGGLSNLSDSLNQTPQNIDVSLSLDIDRPKGPQLPDIGLGKLAAIQDDVEATQARDWFTGPGSVYSATVPPPSPDIDVGKLITAGIGAARDVAIAAVTPRAPQAPQVRIPSVVPAPAPRKDAPGAVDPVAQQPAPRPVPVQDQPLPMPAPVEAPAAAPPAGGGVSKVGIAVGGTAAAAALVLLLYAAASRSGRG